MQKPAEHQPQHAEIGADLAPHKIEYFTPTQEIRYAGFWVRSCALIIDGWILGLPAILLAFLISWSIDRWGLPSYFNRRGEGLLQLAAIFVVWMYFAGMESSSRQATFGKRVLGLIVTDEQGNPLTFGRASARFICKLLSAFPFYLGFVVAAFTSQKQAVHDLCAGTLVIYAPTQES